MNLHIPPYTTRFALTASSIALALALTACGKQDPANNTQVAAQVGDEEISIHQINQVLQRTNLSNTPPQALQTVRQGILEKLIDQELAVAQAMEAKLHRSAEVVTQIESARREILVRAYMQKISNGLPKPSTDELKKYYLDHPALFAQRRIYNVQEVVVPRSTAVEAQLRGFAASAQSVEQASNWLKSQGINFASGGATRAAEQLPLEFLNTVHALADGQSVVLANAQSVTLLHLLSSESSPVEEAVAMPRIENFLINQRTTEAVNAHLKSLRASTQIAYVGEFSNPMDAAPPAAGKTSTVQPETSGQVNPLSTVEKGMAGLK
ncbi:MAG: hypothetical protein RIS44_2310 [Pseudomonadota bacterium]|jgi:EpsD family peptidyl-prolyl cis-trans isomerase